MLISYFCEANPSPLGEVLWTCNMQLDQSLLIGAATLTLDGQVFEVAGSWFLSHQLRLPLSI